MATRVLKVLLFALGMAAISIGASIYLLGASATAGATERLTAILLQRPFTGGEAFSATADSELRFYAPLWIAYGAACVWIARDLVDRRKWVTPVAILFFLGGLGRVLALMADGPPRLPFLILMAIELALPPVLVLLARRTPGKA